MYGLAQNALLHCDPEKAHDLTINWLKYSQSNLLRCTYAQQVPTKPVTVFGLNFNNPVGLAAGLDKNGECVDAFGHMGFGFVEVGTVTPKPQPGNEKPRLFRLPEKQAIINRMGFNNKGVDYLVERVRQRRYPGILGINIGKNKATEERDALNDYLLCLDKVYAHADYVTVNISSPNTPGLRNLQYGDALNKLLEGLKQRQLYLADQQGQYKPLLVKIAPDLSDDEIRSIAQSFISAGIDGVIATNTTLDRSRVSGIEHANEMGGLSGAVLTEKSLHVTRVLADALEQKLPIVSVGGIDSAAAAKARLDAGASLVQIYSAMIYHGPKLVKTIVSGL
ncbi:quinone-dependent dihydroorotate dehydrogenase [Alteromonas oceanisediminis]|uniref:quinone-dependent dihydroorotate dehydrogenase n=1 Tax=Alteromonas oceanisediminis TaxID=2836180 RepID=UPI001BDA7226|nr:quinone-dependent dihydroorotate dehydrogenase [Alteromonas oceanisediminis]MBT0587114.1 quinone-dependent dihydroorotate dehydrogenase [Alteromonas oceanisediminis]